jgi:hypothetical protein
MNSKMKILYNARIHTQNPSQPAESAIVIDREWIVAVGNADLFSQFPQAEKEDMRGRVLLPGLTDAHLHLQYYSLGLQKIDCETDTREECLRRVQERIQKAKPGEWILGHGWNQNVWGAWPTAAELDAIAPNNPVYLTAKSLHAAWANTKALQMARVTSQSPDPQNGQIQRDAGGKATGILLETAMELVGNLVPSPTVEEIANAMEKAQPILWRMGLTGVHDFDRRESFMALQQLHAQGRLKLRVLKNLPVELLDQAHALGLRGGFGDDLLHIGNIKAFMDGALGPHTAAMFQPYIGEENNRGILNMDGEELFEHGRNAAQVGLALTVHAIGDRANTLTLDTFEQTLRARPEARDLRLRVEHAQILAEADIPRFRALGVLPSMQATHCTSDMAWAEERLGPDRLHGAYAWRSLLDTGVIIAGGSDFPVESPNPFYGIYASVTRRPLSGDDRGWQPGQRTTREEAVRSFTAWNAYASHQEDDVGALTPGRRADLIVCSDDVFTCPEAGIKDIVPLVTMVGGEVAYRRRSAAEDFMEDL